MRSRVQIGKCSESTADEEGPCLYKVAETGYSLWKSIVNCNKVS